MAYTHDYQIKIDGINLEGEISFNSGEEPKYSTSAAEEMTIKQHRKIQDLLEGLVVFYKEGGDIEKIEIIRKP